MPNLNYKTCKGESGLHVWGLDWGYYAKSMGNLISSQLLPGITRQFTFSSLSGGVIIICAICKQRVSAQFFYNPENAIYDYGANHPPVVKKSIDILCRGGIPHGASIRSSHRLVVNWPRFGKLVGGHRKEIMFSNLIPSGHFSCSWEIGHEFRLPVRCVECGHNIFLVGVGQYNPSSLTWY